MRTRKYISVIALAVCSSFITAAIPARSQQSFYEQFRSHNVAMLDVQPSWKGPLIQSDALLGQGVKFSVSSAKAQGSRVTSYGNNHGVSLLGGRRFQFDFNPPSYFQNHSATMPDGFGNASTQVKYRIASGNAEHGNFALTAALSGSLGGGYQQNGMLTSFYCPKLLAGKAFGRFAILSAFNGILPTGRIAEQGRAIEWNSTAQLHTSKQTYIDIEDNVALYKGGPDDGKVQNFVTPAGFLVVRRRGWEPTHAVVVFDAGMQIATSGFHTYNHNVVSEMRVSF